MRRLLLAAPLFLAGCTVRGAAAIPTTHTSPPPGGDDLRWLLLAAVGVGILGMGLSVAAAVWLPVKRMACAACAGFATILAVSLAVKAAQPYLLWVVGIGAVLLIGLAVYAICRLHLLARAAVAFGVDMTANASAQSAQAVKDKHAMLQASQGIKEAMDYTLAVVKAAR